MLSFRRRKSVNKLKLHYRSSVVSSDPMRPLTCVWCIEAEGWTQVLCGEVSFFRHVE
jgi:hypothetical protein